MNLIIRISYITSIAALVAGVLLWKSSHSCGASQQYELIEALKDMEDNTYRYVDWEQLSPEQKAVITVLAGRLRVRVEALK